MGEMKSCFTGQNKYHYISISKNEEGATCMAIRLKLRERWFGQGGKVHESYPR